ncbi:leucine-rich repeat-containing protein [Biomphalaria pfeifferi]|uniref:Death domain-associated protein 6 n=1 Tax=Biomphalaria pfeifferi TaxID=112525 RepID=A0AAD8C3Z5_BIOPF|nr:leucine-rich repeat-containing protein [Biomphalaria pfeifferi]
MEPNFAEKVYDEFMSFCSQALAKEDPKFLDIIKLRYEACSDEYRSSEKMATLLKDTQRNMEMERSRLFVHLKDLVTELKAHSVHHKVKKRKREHVKQLSEDSDSDIQPHKSIKLLPCSVLIVKTEVTESDMSEAVPEKPKACWITTGISDSLQEISVANEIQQVSLFKELGYFHNDCSVKSLHTHQSLNQKQKISVDRQQVADNISFVKSTFSAGHSNSSTLIKTKTHGRKCTTIVNVGSSSLQDIQKINVSSHLIARSSASKNYSVDLAIRGSEQNSSKNGSAAFGEGTSADSSFLGNKSIDRISSNSEQMTCYGAISADGTQSKEIISSSSISDTTIRNPSNESKMTFFQSLETGQDCLETSNLEKPLDIGVPDNCLLNKDHPSPLIATETSSIVTTGHSDFLDSTKCLVETSNRLCPVEEVITKDISVRLTDCQQHSPLKSKRAVLTTLSSYVPSTSNKGFQSSSSDSAEKSAKTLKADSKAQDSSDEFQDPQKTEVMNLKHQRRVKKLEDLLESLRNEIEKCQNEELSLDHMDEETSTYIYEDKLKKKFVTAWNMLCKITKRSVTTGRPVERTVKFGGTRYKEINKRLERFLNKTKIFPDFTDIKNIVKLTNKKYKMNLSSKSIDVISREAFVDIGELLQHRRHQDFIATIGNRQTDFLRNSNTDPYLTDPEFRRKLDSNRKVARSNLDHVIAKYSKLQDEKTDGIEEDSDDEEEENTHRKTNKMLMEEDEENSDKDEQRSTSSECSHSSKKIQKETRLSESPPAKSTYKYSNQKLNTHSCSSDTDLKSDSDDSTVKSFVKALGLNPLSLCVNNDDKLCGALDDSSVTNESVIVLEGSPVKSGDKFPTLGKENYLASGSGQSMQDAILLKGPNIKFTARKASTPPLSGKLEMSHSISYDDIAMENEEDEEDQSSESDCSGEEEEDDDEDIMVIEDSVSEVDSESSRGASPISVISLSSSIDDDDDNLKSNAELTEIKLEPTSGGVMNSRGQQNVTTCISHVLDLASSALLNQNATIDRTLSQKLPTHSTEFLDLATSKSSRQGSISTTQIKHERRFVTPTESGFYSNPDNIVDISKSKKDLLHTFIPITPPEDTDFELLASQEKDVEIDISHGNKFKTKAFSEDKAVAITNHEDDFASADKVEITIEIDDESFDIGLPLAAENDSFISHQSKQKRGIDHQVNEDSVIDIDELSNDTKLFKDAKEMHAKIEKMSLNKFPPKEKVIVIDEASQEVSTSAQSKRVCKEDNKIVSSCKNLFLENQSNQKSRGFSESPSLEEVIDLDASHNVKQFDSSRSDNGTDKSVHAPGISEYLRSDNHRPTDNVSECYITDSQQSSGVISECHISESHKSVDNVNETGENVLPSSDCTKHPSTALTPMDLETFPDNPLIETSETSKMENVSLHGINPEKQLETFHETDSLHPNIANQNVLIIAESTSELLNINFKDDKIVADVSVSLDSMANVNMKEPTPEGCPPNEEHLAIEVDKSKETLCDVVLKKIGNVNIEEVKASLNVKKSYSDSSVNLNLQSGGKVSEEKTKPRIDKKNLVLETCNTNKQEIIKGENTNTIIGNIMEEINDDNTEEINNENTEEINDDYEKLSVKNSEKINDENEKANDENTEIIDDKNTEQHRDEHTETLNTEDTEKNETFDNLSFKTIVEIANDEKIEEKRKDENIEKKNEDLEQTSDENLKIDSKSPAENRKDENSQKKMGNENLETTLFDVDTKQKQNNTKADILKDNAINVKNKANEMINKDEKQADSVAHKPEINSTAHNSEETPKSTLADLQEDCEDDDVFNSIFRICDQIIQNSAPEEKVIDHKLVENVSQDEHSCSTENTVTNDKQVEGNIVEITCSDLSKEESSEILVKENDVLPTKDKEDCLVGQTTLEDVTDETDNSALSMSPTTGLLANTDNSKANAALPISPITAVTDKTDIKISEKRIVDNDSEKNTDKPQTGTCEDELEIIEELSNAVGRVQSKRTKEEDRLWVSQQLDKLNSALSCKSSTVQPSHTESSDITDCVHDDTSSKTVAEVMPDLEDVECLDNDTEEAVGSKNALVSNSEGTTSKTVAVKRRKKSSELVNFDSAEPAASTSKEKSSDVEIIGCENIEPPAKKHHVDTDFITELISSVYHEPLLNKVKKSKPTSASEDEDVQVVETNIRPRILRQDAPSMKNSKAIRGQDVFKNYTAIRGNKMSTVSTRVNSTYLVPSSRGQLKNVSRFSSTQIQTSQRLASNSTPYSAKRMPNPLPCLGPRVPIPRIQPPSSFGSPRLNSRSFQMNSPPRPFSNPGAMFPNRQKFVDRRVLVSPYFRSSPSTSSPVNIARQSSPNIRQQRPPTSHTAGRGRPFQLPSKKNVRQPVRNLDGTEIVLDDSDTEDQNSNPTTTPVILSVQSLSSVNASKETKSPGVKKPGDVIVLSDSD